VDFDRLTITLLALRDDAPGLTPEQEDALHDAQWPTSPTCTRPCHLLAAGPGGLRRRALPGAEAGAKQREEDKREQIPDAHLELVHGAVLEVPAGEGRG